MLVCFRLLWVYSGAEPCILSILSFDHFLFGCPTNLSLIFGNMAHRLGFIIDFLSKATLVGFMAGAAVIVSLQQLKGLLGISHFTSKMQIVPVLASVLKERHEVRLKWPW